MFPKCISVSSVYLSQVCGLDTHSTSESFPDINHLLSHSSLKNFSLQTDVCWGIWPQTGWLSGCYAHFPLLYYPLRSPPYFPRNCKYSVYEHVCSFSAVCHNHSHIICIWFPSKRMSPASNVTASPKHQCKQHSERWCAGKPNRTELCLGPKMCMSITKQEWGNSFKSSKGQASVNVSIQFLQNLGHYREC